MTSQQVSWSSVHEYVTAHLPAHDWPMIGSPAWCALPDNDPAKIAAVYDAAQHWALRVEGCQQAMADAGSEISAAVDWSAVSRAVRARQEFYEAKPWLKRVAS